MTGPCRHAASSTLHNNNGSAVGDRAAAAAALAAAVVGINAVKDRSLLQLVKHRETKTWI